MGLGRLGLGRMGLARLGLDRMQFGNRCRGHRCTTGPGEAVGSLGGPSFVPLGTTAFVVRTAPVGQVLAYRVEHRAHGHAQHQSGCEEEGVHLVQRTGRRDANEASWSAMETQTLQLEVPGGTMPVYEALPEGTPRGAVIVIQEAFGVNPHIEDVTRRFATAGYHAVAPHLFHRTGSPAYGYDDFSEVMPHMMALSDTDMVTDVEGAVAYLHAAGWADRQIGIVGFCMGGRVTFLVAGHLALGAGVGFYGGGIVEGRSEALPSLLPLVTGMRTPWLGLFGDADGGIPVEEVERLRDELNAGADVDTAIVRYPDAEHGFHCDARPSYNEAAATDGWARTLTWLDDHLAPAG